MRVIIHAIGSAGDVHPFLGIGVTLKARGHEVHLATGPAFERAVTGCGLIFHALGTLEHFEKLRDHPDLWHPRRSMLLLVKEALRPSYGPILDITRKLHLPGETVLLGSSLAFGARNASELLDIPMATVHLAPSLFPSVHRQPEIHGMVFGQGAPRFLKALQWRIASKVSDHFILPDLNRFRAGHGLPPARKVMAEWSHSPGRVIALFPDWFAPRQPDWPIQVRMTGFPLFDEKGLHEIPAGVKAFLDDGEPPVVFTPGSAMARGHSFFKEAANALKRLNRRGILLSPYVDSIPTDLPPSIRHFPYIPFSEVLPHAAALVYHGGIGTCSQAMQAGIPHFIQPMAYDQLDTLSRIRDLGIGVGLAPAKFKKDAIAAKLDQLLGDPSFKTRAQELVGHFEPARWMDETCALVEELLPR